MDTETFFTVERIAYSVISLGIAYLVKGQKSIRKEAKQGRAVLHTKIDDKTKELSRKITKFTERLVVVETQNKINHPEQL